MSHFLETSEGDNISGYEFSKWIGWDFDAEFIPSEENKNIGKIERFNYPEGIRENDVISLHDGTCTRICQVEKTISVHQKDDYISFVWYFTDGKLIKIPFQYTGCYPKTVEK